MKKVLLLFILCIIPACGQEIQQETTPEEINIGVLLHLSGDLVSSGETSKASIIIETEKILDYMKANNYTHKINIIIEDTETDPILTLRKLRSFKEQGISIVIGPQLSSVMEIAKGFADQNEMILIGPSSTAPRLSIAHDHVYRLVPDDRLLIRALVKQMQKDEITTVIEIIRGDVWGDSFREAGRTEFQELNGAILDGIVYSPVNLDFSQEIESLNREVENAIETYGKDHVAVVFVGFDEAIEIFKEASNYPSLKSVKWYGTDASALNKNIIADSTAAEFARATRFTSPQFCAGFSDRAIELRSLIQQELGRKTDDYALLSADALWLAVLTHIAAANSDFSTLQANFEKITDEYDGISGRTILNEAGDRKYGDFNIWTVEETYSGYEWKALIRYCAETDSFEKV